MLESFVIFNSQSFPLVFHQRRIYTPLIKMWRCHASLIAVFPDDGLGGGATELTAKTHSLKVHTDLIRFGFLVKLAKS